MKKDDYISDDNLISATSKIRAIYDTTIILDKSLIEKMKEYDIDLVAKDYWSLRKVKFKDRYFYDDKYFSNRNIPLNPLALSLSILVDGTHTPKVTPNYGGNSYKNPGFFIKISHIQNKYYFHGSEENLMMFRLCI